MTVRYDPIRDVTVECENRKDRGLYDEETPSTMWHPNGSLLASFDRRFNAAATREILGIEFATIQPIEPEGPTP